MRTRPTGSSPPRDAALPDPRVAYAPPPGTGTTSPAAVPPPSAPVWLLFDAGDDLFRYRCGLGGAPAERCTEPAAVADLAAVA